MVDDSHPPDSERRGMSDVQLAEFVVQDLFGRYEHKIPLPTSSPGDDSLPSVLILYGPNGVGKTTILRMLDGLIRLDFEVFRQIPFGLCYLEFTTGERLQVRRERTALHVTFSQHDVLLKAKLGEKGAFKAADDGKVKAFRNEFFRSIENISFEFVDADRARRSKYQAMARRENFPVLLRDSGRTALEWYQAVYGAQGANDEVTLAASVTDFIRDAQLDSQAFFGTGEPDVFGRMIEDLSGPPKSPKPITEIRGLLDEVHDRDRQHSRLGLRTDKWDYEKLAAVMDQQLTARNSHALIVLETYADFLSSRSRARQLIAERLLTFEKIMAEFLLDKRVMVDAKMGLRILARGAHLDEFSLSSGEYQLLYLMVAALTTRRKGTVLAIDEPELSMHISWQRKLVKNLVRCASRAAPQIILATHSPEVASEFSEYMVELSSSVS